MHATASAYFLWISISNEAWRARTAWRRAAAAAVTPAETSGARGTAAGGGGSRGGATRCPRGGVGGWAAAVRGPSHTPMVRSRWQYGPTGVESGGAGASGGGGGGGAGGRGA